jgi:hypothetical protein
VQTRLEWLQELGKSVAPYVMITGAGIAALRYFRGRWEKRVELTVRSAFAEEIEIGKQRAQQLADVATAVLRIETRLGRHFGAIEEELDSLHAIVNENRVWLEDHEELLNVALGIERRLSAPGERRQRMLDLIEKAEDRRRSRRRSEDTGKEG